MGPTNPKEHPEIVVLDGHTLNPGDLSWDALRLHGAVTIYDRSTPAQVVERAKNADILLVNKVVVNAEMLAELPRLKCICVTATGYNNIDIKTARKQGVTVCNAVGYSTDSVAQHVFGLLLELTNRVSLHHASVQAGEWSAQPDFSYWKQPMIELSHKTMGIYGFGRIGQKVAHIAMALGMRVLATHKHPERDARVGVTFVDLETLFSNSDVISLNTPLTEKNHAVINASLLRRMKPTAYLINTGRGELINESDLKTALEAGWLAGAALDVLTVEPPPADHPLFGLPNCLITPHLAWASREARQRLLDMTVENVRGFLHGDAENVVN